MSRRRGFIGTAKVSTDGGVSPNAYMPYVTAEVRVFAPPRATRAEIDVAIEEALADARRQLDDCD